MLSREDMLTQASGQGGDEMDSPMPVSDEHLRALDASAVLGATLGEKLAQRPVMSMWSAKREAETFALVVSDACSTPTEVARLLQGARALEGTQTSGSWVRIREIAEVGAFLMDPCGLGHASDLAALGWPLARKLEFAVQVCRALGDLHEAGIVHGCLSPDNILLDDDFAPVFTEVGMVSVADSFEGDRSNVFGYGWYAAPEACTRGEIGPHADVYSVGRLLQFLALDRAAMADADLAALSAQHPMLGAIVKRCTRTAVADRYADMAELAREIVRCGREHAGPAGSVPLSRTPGAKPSRPPPAPDPAAALKTAKTWDALQSGPRSKAWPPWSGAAAVLGAVLILGGSSLVTLPELVPRVLSAAVGICLAVGTLALPFRGRRRGWSRPLLALTLIGACVMFDPAGRVAGHGTDRALKGGDSAARAKAARALVAKGNKSLRGARLMGADLSTLDLSHVDFENSDLTSVSFKDSSLDSANLDGATLSFAKLQGANLSHARVSGALGMQSATCDGKTVAPAGWYCDDYHLLHRGAK